MVASNLKSMFILLQAVAPHMIEAGYGRVVCFSSLAARSAVNPNRPTTPRRKPEFSASRAKWRANWVPTASP